MKNYVALYFMATVDTSVPVVIGYGFWFSQSEALKYQEDNPLPSPDVYTAPRRYYILLNKWNVATIISQYPLNPDTDGFLAPNPGLYTQVPPTAKRFTGRPIFPNEVWDNFNPLWQFDDQDKWSFFANRTARNREFRDEGD